MVVAGYETFLVDSLKLSPRLVAKQLSRCAQKVFEKESASDVDMFGRQVSYSLSFVRMRMKAVTTGKTTHLAIKRICECLQKMGYADDFHQEDRSSPRLKRVHSPDRSAGSLHMWTGCAGIHCTASLCKRHRSQTSPGPPKLAKFEVSVFRSSLRLRLIFAMYGLASKNAEEQASSKKAPASPPISIGSSSSSKVAWCQWSRQRLKTMDVPNLFLQTFEAAAADGGSMKRPAAAKKNTTKKAPAGSASADGNKPKEPVHVSSQLPKAKSTPNKDSSSSPGNSRYVMMRESCHYVAVSHRTYITGKIGKTKPLLIEIHSRLRGCTPLSHGGELRQLMRDRREEILKTE
ncbi:hypothetical protein AK812_SmicGene36451 [Symbiodinium microadriaticum]|uniref:Uncharacterized protein n=1 Tax=Symbiodinium microadriaticum TaxID=2951 RepID=A0A1Q9CIY5_SYMMI|nr:hypothetical protein AK812_SmicGene36451 [Symbiodinium microadriaticum]CAE7229212.1 unnamed protein product [Symbiodinium microadriaticum]